ncbi:MAG: NAD(P)-dependent oxidoreductase [Flavobacteriales bacterium]
MRVLVIDKLDETLEKQFVNHGWIVETDTTSPRAIIEKKLPLFDGVIVRSRFPIDAAFIDKGVNLKFIGRPGAGLENIDTAYCEKKDVLCFRSPEGNCDALGEHTLGMLLALLNKFRQADNQVRQGIWDRKSNRGTELGRKTVGIIGYGYMGAAFARRLTGFGVHVLAYDKYKSGFGDEYVKEATLEQIQEKADIVSVHTPLTPETEGMVNLAFYKNFKKSIVIINTARGGILKLDDLVEAMQSNLVWGACLDVLEYENSSFGLTLDTHQKTWDYLRQSDKIILTPHVAGITHEGEYKMAYFLAEKILAHFEIKTP